MTLATPLLAEPVAYTLDRATSTVAFTYDFSGNPVTGAIPVQSADLRLDLRDIANSQVDVTLNTAAADGGFAFATAALREPGMLDSGRHPTMRFRAKRISGDLRGADIDGTLTLRGVSKPVRLRAELYRQQGTAARDLSRLAVLLTGTVDRNEFGVSAYPGFVGPDLRLRILINVSRS